MTLAAKMREKTITKVVYKPETRFRKGAESNNLWEDYFGLDEVAQCCLRLSPIKRPAVNEYAFIHVNLQEYFVTRLAKIETDAVELPPDEAKE